MFSGDPGHWKSASQERDFDRDETPQFPEPFPNSLQVTATEVDCPSASKWPSTSRNCCYRCRFLLDGCE